MADIGQTGMSGEHSRRFATVNDDEFNRILTEKSMIMFDLMSYNKTVHDFQFQRIQGLIKPWKVINFIVLFPGTWLVWIGQSPLKYYI